jgi:hypothetical protein
VQVVQVESVQQDLQELMVQQVLPALRAQMDLRVQQDLQELTVQQVPQAQMDPRVQQVLKVLLVQQARQIQQLLLL